MIVIAELVNYIRTIENSKSLWRVVGLDIGL